MFFNAIKVKTDMNLWWKKEIFVGIFLCFLGSINTTSTLIIQHGLSRPSYPPLAGRVGCVLSNSLHLNTRLDIVFQRTLCQAMTPILPGRRTTQPSSCCCCCCRPTLNSPTTKTFQMLPAKLFKFGLCQGRHWQEKWQENK